MHSNPRWPPYPLGSLEQNLDALANAVRIQGDRTDDEQIWLTRFLVVRSCGYIEQVAHQCTIAHIEAKSGATVRAFALSWMSRSRNPSPENLLQLLGRFDTNLMNEFTEMLDENDSELRRDLSVLVVRRHGIAHGLNEGLGSRRALELVAVAKYVADWLILVLNPDFARVSLTAGRRGS